MEVGLIGTGLMGLPMAERLLSVGTPVIAYNRTEAKLEPLREAGVAIAPSPAIVFQSCPCIILMVTDAAAIREVVFSPEVRAVLAGKTVIQMGTIAPGESRAIAGEIRAAGGSYFEAPVLGSIPEVKSGKLLVMVGAEPEQFDQFRDVLEAFGADPVLVGPVGTAAALKLALNQMIGSLTTAFATSLGFVMGQGVPLETFMAILRQSALYAPTFDKKLQRMVDRNYDNPNFPTRLLLKDTRLFLQEAQTMDLETSSVEALKTVLERAIDLSLADADYSALYSAVNPPEG